MAACSGLVGVTSLSTTTASSSFPLNSVDDGGPPPSSVNMSATTMSSSFSLVVSSCSTWLWAASSSRFLLLIKNNTRHEVFILIFDFTSLLSEFKGTSHFYKFCGCLYCDFFIRQHVAGVLNFANVKTLRLQKSYKIFIFGSCLGAGKYQKW